MTRELHNGIDWLGIIRNKAFSLFFIHGIVYQVLIIECKVQFSLNQNGIHIENGDRIIIILFLQFIPANFI